MIGLDWINLNLASDDGKTLEKSFADIKDGTREIGQPYERIKR